MRRIMLAMLALVLLGGASGCAIGKKEMLIRQFIGGENEMTDLLSQINSGESARQWEPVLKKIKNNLDNTKTEWEKIANEKWSEQDKEALKPFISEDLVYLSKRLSAELQRLSSPLASANIKDAWKVLEPLFRSYSFPPVQLGGNQGMPMGPGPVGPMGPRGPMGPGPLQNPGIPPIGPGR